jgi:hypothetical protein
LIPEDNVDDVLSWLKDKDMACSPYAAQYFMESLFQNGADDKALKLITADGDRSWKHMVDSGTTISWEAWDLKYKPNQDWNHAWGAAPANLLPRFVLGVEPLAPGWTSARIRPCPGGLKHARGQVPTSKGPIEVDWNSETSFTMTIKLPAMMKANVELPAADGSTSVLVNGERVEAEKRAGRWILKDSIRDLVKIEVL